MEPAPPAAAAARPEARGSGSRFDPAIVSGIALGLLALFLGLWLARGYRFPVGSDAPVYLWWTRLASREGLSAVGFRPGVSALALTLEGTTRQSTVTVVAALEAALGASAGLGALALVRDRAPRAAWILAGVLSGAFAVHLVQGYLSNLAFAALFLAAAACLAAGTRRGAIGAAGVLGAAGLAHPLFFLIGLAILAVTAALALRAERGRFWDTEAGRIAIAGVGGGAIAAAGLLAMLVGPAPPRVITSKDGFLRATGMTGELRHLYWERFLQHWARYVEWAAVPLAIAGLRDARGFEGRFLRAWAVVAIAGVAASLATGRAPADRFEAFAYVMPILAAFGLVRLWRWLKTRRRFGRSLAWAASASLLAAMLAGPVIVWVRAQPYLSPLEVQRATEANRYAVAAPRGTPLLFWVNDNDQTLSFLATRAENVIRAAMPPGRLRDVHMFVPPSPSGTPTAERAALSRFYDQQANQAINRTKRVPIIFSLAPFDRPDLASSPAAAPGLRLGHARPIPAPRPVDPLLSSSPWAIAGAGVGIFMLLGALGYGWSAASIGDGATALALAPAFGAAGLVLLGIVLERLGLALDGGGGVAVSALVGVGGYGVRHLGLRGLRVERRAGANAAP